MAEHTVKAFDSEISQLRGLIAEMGGLAEVAIRDAVDALAEAAAKEPAFRTYALTALSAMDEVDARDKLYELLESNSAETRYGAFRALTLSAVGKSLGKACVTLPVAAHSVPRWYVAMKPTHSSESTPWPMGVWNTRPLP